MYYVQNSNFTTHFYSKDNLILYKRDDETSLFELVSDFVEGSYRFIEFNNVNFRIMDGAKMTLRTARGNWLLVVQNVELQDNKRYIIALDLLNNRNLLLANKENEIYSIILPVMSNNIIPIIQVRIDLYNIDLSKSEPRFRKLVDLDILFNAKSCFVSVKHNRVSFPVLVTDSTKSGFRIENVKEFLFLSFSTFSLQDDHDDNVDINFSSCFILSELSLVSQIPNVDF